MGSDWKIAEWTTELASELLNRSQDGKDSWKDHLLYVWHSTTGYPWRVGEQVVSQPLSSASSKKKRSLKERWVFATWMSIRPQDQ